MWRVFFFFFFFFFFFSLSSCGRVDYDYGYDCEWASSKRQWSIVKRVVGLWGSVVWAVGSGFVHHVMFRLITLPVLLPLVILFSDCTVMMCW